MIDAVRFYGVLLLCGALGACYNPSFGDCQVSCASGACPAGLECQSGVCRAPGMTGPCTTIDGGGIDAPGLSIDDMAEASIDFLCKYAVRCGQFEDMPSCTAFYSNIVVQPKDAVAAVQAGTVIFHGDKAKQCFDARDTLGCERWKQNSNRFIDPSCSGVFEGTRHDGETCAINEQCVSQQCMKSSCTMACCPGTCAGDRPPGPRNLGESCTSLDRCQNSYCDQFTMVCAAYKVANDSCSSSDQCGDGMGCIVSAQFPAGRCTPLLATNGPCGQTAECLMLADTCKAGACKTGGLMGSTCTNAAQSECQAFHPCSNNQCALPPRLNQSCLNVGACTEGYCSYAADPNMPICTPKVQDLGTCNPNMGGTECTSGYCESGKCMPKPVCN